METRIRLILLDFDGTLADTRRANALAYTATLREAGIPLSEEEYAARYFGMRCEEFLTHLGIADPAERDRLRRRKIELYPTFFDSVRLNRPLWEFCQQFRAQAAACGSSRRQPREHRARHAPPRHPRRRGRNPLRPRDHPQQTPPRLFPRGNAPRGVTPRETLIFEDSEIGIEAARRSGASYFVVRL